MSETTNISFTHHTASPWIGCTKVNDDCKNCYADWLDEKRFSKTLGGATPEKPISHWGKGAPRVRTVGFWRDVPKWNASTHKGRRIFCSLCDWLDAEVPIEWLADFLKLVSECQNLTWMLFTKRPELFRVRLLAVCDWITGKKTSVWWNTLKFVTDWLNGNPPHHVWPFASAGNQKNWETMRGPLLQIPAVVRGVSCEPMTGQVIFDFDHEDFRNQIHVVIFGGESNQEQPARECKLEWIHDGVQQCFAAGVCAYVKQLGSFATVENANIFDWPDDAQLESNSACVAYSRIVTKHKAGADINEWPDQLRVQQLPEDHE